MSEKDIFSLATIVSYQMIVARAASLDCHVVKMESQY